MTFIEVEKNTNNELVAVKASLTVEELIYLACALGQRRTSELVDFAERRYGVDLTEDIGKFDDTPYQMFVTIEEELQKYFSVNESEY